MNTLIETEIGTIAPDWKVEPLERVCEPPQYGFTASAEDKGNVRFLRITDITDSGIKWPTVPFCECPPKVLSKYLLASGDIVFARIGATTGKSYLITDAPPCIFASYLIRVRAKPEIDPLFLSQFFLSAAYWRQVDAQKNANLKKGVSGSLLKALTVPVPPIAEQRKIAGVLGLVQQAMEQQERLIALTTELKKTLLHQLFTQGLRGEPQKQTEIGPVPESWEVVKIGDLLKFSSGKTRPKDTAPTPSPSREFPVFGGNGILGYSSCFLLEEPTLLLGRVGEYCGCAHHTDGPAWVSDNALYTKEVLRDIDTRYAAEYFTYANLNQYSSRAGQPLITQGIISKVRMPLPLLDEQREILSPLLLLNQKLKQHQRKHAAFAAMFRTLLHQLMTAQIRVHELDLSELCRTNETYIQESDLRHADNLRSHS
ncbi:MAG: restriction endonuclease subunit S [Candidatus Sumerlaeota bacterium]|nr:restriction endonuclease subunit S [Candidatus Sumerlaeota bacterium]